MNGERQRTLVERIRTTVERHRTESERRADAKGTRSCQDRYFYCMISQQTRSAPVGTGTNRIYPSKTGHHRTSHARTDISLGLVL